MREEILRQHRKPASIVSLSATKAFTYELSFNCMSSMNSVELQLLSGQREFVASHCSKFKFTIKKRDGEPDINTLQFSHPIAATVSKALTPEYFSRGNSINVFEN